MAHSPGSQRAGSAAAHTLLTPLARRLASSTRRRSFSSLSSQGADPLATATAGGAARVASLRVEGGGHGEGAIGWATLPRVASLRVEGGGHGEGAVGWATLPRTTNAGCTIVGSTDEQRFTTGAFRGCIDGPLLAESWVNPVLTRSGSSGVGTSSGGGGGDAGAAAQEDTDGFLPQLDGDGKVG